MRGCPENRSTAFPRPAPLDTVARCAPPHRPLRAPQQQPVAALRSDTTAASASPTGAPSTPPMPTKPFAPHCHV